MSPETDTVAAPTGCLVNVSSYMNGNRMQETRANNVADILKDQNISTTDVQIEILDLQGNQKPGRANTVLATGDTVQIMRKSNKSGNTKHNIDATVTEVTHIHPLPTTMRVTRPRTVYRFHELKKKGDSFDVIFNPRTEKEQKALLGRVAAAKNYFCKQKDNSRKQFVTELLTTKPSRNGSHTLTLRVWRSK